MDVKAHYDNHLAPVYSWMSGDFTLKQQEQQDFFVAAGIVPFSSGVALDLGCGHGLQTVSLVKLGFRVRAIDFSRHLLDELQQNKKELEAELIEDDICNVKKYADPQAELIVCCGDTLTHLENKKQLLQFISDCCSILSRKGKLLLSFRDYSNELVDEQRFIPVKSDEQRILTCVLEYQPEHVRVYDLLHEKTANGWQQKISSYNKLRVSTLEILKALRENGMDVHFNQVVNRLTTIIATK